MIDHQTDEEMILIDEVPDETLEAAASVALGGLPTLPNTYCFACPAIRCEATEPSERFERSAKAPLLRVLIRKRDRDLHLYAERAKPD